MPSTVTASRRHSESSDDQLNNEECPSQIPIDDSRALDSDTCYTTSCGRNSSDASSANSSSFSTPEHSTRLEKFDERENCNELSSQSTNFSQDNAEESTFLFFKFKRKNRLIAYQFLKKLRIHLIMWLKFVLSALLVLATIQFSFPQSPHQVVPHPFFPSHTLVKDFYQGDLQLLAEHLQYSDLALVMYYAPWDRESQLARTQFAHAARILHNQVVFCAINCWQPDSFCRLNHKVTSFPAIVLHVNTGALKGSILRESRAFPYNGPIVSEHLVRFLTAALRPYQHVPDRKHLASLQLTHSAVMLTYIHGIYDTEYLGSDDAATYRAEQQFAFWYRASLHWLDYDKRAEVTWAVITTPKLAGELGIINSSASEDVRPTSGLPPIRMLMADVNYEFNGTLKNSREPKPLLEWVMSQLLGTAGWLEVSGAKSSVLNAFLHRGPSLLVFTPDYPQQTHNSYFDVVRGLWLQYSTCAPVNVSVQDTRAGRMARFLLDSATRHSANLAIARADCTRHSSFYTYGLGDTLATEVASSAACSTLDSPDTSSVQSDHCQNGHFTCHPFMPFFVKPGSGGVGELVWSLVGDACQSLFGFNAPTSKHAPPPCSSSSLRPSNTSNPTTSPPLVSPSLFQRSEGGVVDERVQELQQWQQEEACRRLRTSHHHEPQADAAPHAATLGVFAGHACISNRTLKFGVIDSKLHADMAVRWGLNKTTTRQNGAVLVDLERETHYVLDADLSAASLAAFVANFTQGLLDRVELTRPPVSHYRSDYSDDFAPVAVSVEQSVLSSLRRYGRSSSSGNIDDENESELSLDGKLQGSVVLDASVNTASKRSTAGTTADSGTRVLEKQDDSIVEEEESGNGAEAYKEWTEASSKSMRNDSGGHGQEVSIRELTSDTYLNFTHTPGKGVLVLHYSRSCAFCTSVSHVLLTVATHFADLALQTKESKWKGISFARIDMSSNTLPWHLNFDLLPTFIYYPPFTKSSSRVLDARVPLTVGNLMRFVATQLSPRLRTRLALTGCSSSCYEAIESQVPFLKSHLKNRLRKVSARLLRVTEALTRAQLDASLEENIPGMSSWDAPNPINSPLNSVVGEYGSENTLEEELHQVPVQSENLNAAQASTPLNRLEMLYLTRAALTDELTSLRSRAQYLDILHKSLEQRTLGDGSTDTPWFFWASLPLTS
ncbi:thioredoxin domain-containing protein 11 isoform X2 [Hyalella azteca]|uniref:Thioredoxin domain-containing protein 11 isoform X2 n=1 Tax=Hyalella azteca TaxID=294128 RepID=A0A8B7NRE6_HYAAZ|nr:thioredoxin domain-containing protein 11 isoform X2 [Hyalella azteca]